MNSDSQRGRGRSRCWQFLERTRIAIVHDEVVGSNDDFELEPCGRSGTAMLLAGRFNCRMFVLENTAVKSRKHQDDHHVDHRHDIQIVAPRVVAGVIASD